MHTGTTKTKQLQAIIIIICLMFNILYSSYIYLAASSYLAHI